MKGLLWLLLLPLCGLVYFSAHGSPTKGPYVMENRVRVPGGSPGVHVMKEKFRGGQRACVIALGDHNPVVDLEIIIYDAQDRVVAHDKGDGDTIAAIWYPPREGEYKIEIRNPGQEYNDVYVAVK